jgi:prepilin-type N-terminal cleavage/methylation domain-containing protein
MKMRLTSSLNSSGFTLIELMVAMFILAGLSTLTGEAIKNAINSREKYNRQIRDIAQVRDALRVMDHDIELAFHHRDIFTTMMNDIRKKQAGGGAPPPPGATPPPTEGQPGGDQKPIPKNLTAFIGEKDSLNFTSLSNTRLYRDVPESEQMEVGYYIRECKSHRPGKGKTAEQSSRCLVRRTNPNIDEDVTQGGNEVVLIEHVSDFKLRYFGPQRDEWVDVWKTGKDGDAISKENFPYAVEVSISAHDENDPRSKPVSMVLVAPIRFPNNPPKQENKDAGAGGQ